MAQRLRDQTAELQGDELKSQRLAEKTREARQKGEASLRATLWVDSGLFTCL